MDENWGQTKIPYYFEAAGDIHPADGAGVVADDQEDIHRLVLPVVQVAGFFYVKDQR